MDAIAKGIIVFALAVLLVTVSAYFVEPLEIQDTNPATYAVVPLLMLPLFSLFFYKERRNLQARPEKRDLLIASGLFAVFILALLALRFWLSFEFISFGAYFLIFPIAIASFAAAIFGARNVGKFKPLLVYTVFASPAVLWPLLELDPMLAKANTLLIFALLKPLVQHAYYIAPITIGTASSLIGIGQTCVSIGVFIAAAFFLLPLAYLYDGKLAKKAAWVASGIGLLLLLNFLRMFSITYVWLAYGPSKELLFVHEFIGSILFYADIVIMLLVAGAFGLGFAKRAKRKARTQRQKPDKMQLEAYALAVAFAVFYLLMTLNYSTAFNIQPTALANARPFNAQNATGIARAISQVLTQRGFKSIYLTMSYGTSIIAWNNTINSSNPLLLYITRPGLGTTAGILKNNTLKAWFYFLDRNGTRSEIFDIISNNTEFFVYVTRVALTTGNSSAETANAYVIEPSYAVSKESCSSYAGIYTYAYNLFNPAFYNGTERQKLVSAYCIAQKIM
ncbi:MAG: exosortase/archaeosortase family protein [Candidatus Micrarchaeia archaeon]